MYSLVDPRTNAVRYIGVTNNISRRVYQHKYWAKNSKRKHYVYNWINELFALGLDFGVNILENNLTQEQAFEREIYWIAKFDNLTNLDGGGKGFGANNQIWRGRKHSKATKEKISKGNLGHIVSLETRKRITEAKNTRKGDECYKSKNDRGSASKKVEVYCAETGKMLYSFSSILECSKVLNLNRGFIGRRARENKIYRKYKFKVYD